MSAFSQAGTALPNAVAMPLRRRLVQVPPPTPPTTQATTPQSRLPTFLRGSHPAWPPAPEQPPLFAPPLPAHYPPAAAAEMHWGTGIAQVPLSAPIIAPQASASPFGMMDAANYTPPAAPSFPPEMAWQGIDPLPPMPESQPATALPDVPTDSPPELQQPMRRAERSVLPAVLLLIFIVGASLWLVADVFLPKLAVEIPLAVKKPTTEAVTPIVKPEPDSSSSPPPPPPEPVPEVRRAQLPLIPQPMQTDPSAAVEQENIEQAAQRLFKALLDAPTTKARAAFVAEAEEHSEDMAEFFAKGAPEWRGLKPMNTSLRALPGQREIPLFLVMTSQNEDGALLRLVPQTGGSFLLDWPVFAETHQQRLKRFLQTKSRAPSWHHTGLCRSHAPDLPQALSDSHHCYDLLGTTPSSVQCVAVVPQDTPLGRFMERETQWGTGYLARLLLQHRDVESSALAVVILDCEGATSGSYDPATPP